MTVVQPNSIAGINSLTVASGDSLSVHKSDGTLIREIVSATGVGTFYAISVGTAGTISNTGNAALAGIVTANGGVKVGAAISLHSNGNLGITGIMTAASFSGSGANLSSLPAQATLSNNADNRVITGGSGVNLNGEVNLTWDATDLKVTASGQPTVKVGSTNAGGAAIYLDGDSDGDWSGNDYSWIRHNTSGNLEYNVDNPADAGAHLFEISDVEKLRIGSTGLVTIQGNSANAAHTHLKFINTDSTSSGETGQTNDIEFFFTDNVGNSYKGAKISAYKQNDWVGNADYDAGLAFSTVDNSVSFENAYSERLRIDSSGRIIIGATATDDRDGYDSSLQVSGTDGDKSSASIGRWSGDASAPGLVLSKSRNGTIGSHTVVQANDYLGVIQFQGDDGTNYHAGAQIQAKVESGVGNDDMPTSLLFATNAGGTATTTALTIDSSQNATFAGTIDDSKGGIRTIPKLAKTSSYTLIASDLGKCVSTDSGVEVPNAVFAAGDAVTIWNDSSSSITITQGSGFQLRKAGETSTGNVTLKNFGMATIWWNTGGTAVITGNLA